MAAVTVIGLFVFNRLAAPMPRPLPGAGGNPPDYRAIVENVSPATVRQDLETINAFGNRFAGAAGSEKTADWLAATFRQLGYIVIEQPFPQTVAVTRYARLLDADGKVIEGVRLTPFLPNNYRTCTTPPDGLTGTVYEGKLGLAREFRTVNLNGNFALLPIGTSWTTLAGMGVKAVLYFKPEDKQDGADWQHSVTASLNIPRYFVEGDLDRLRGKQVTIQAQVDYESRTVRNIIAYLPAAAGGKDALVLCGYYDSYSYLPDVAPGASQACNLPVLLACARQFAADKAELKRSVMLIATAAHCQGLAGSREFLAALGRIDARAQTLKDAARLAADADRAVLRLESVKSVITDPAYWQIVTEDGEEAFWKTRSREERTAFTETVLRVFDRDHMTAYEALTQARVNWIREGMPVKSQDGEEPATFATSNAARQEEQVVLGRLTTPLFKLKADPAVQRQLADPQWRQRFTTEAALRLTEAKRRQARHAARYELAQLFGRFEHILFLGIDVTAQTGRLAMVTGEPPLAARCMPADSEVAVQFQHAAEGLNKSVSEAAGTNYQKTPAGDERFSNLLRDKDAGGLPFCRNTEMGVPFYFDSSGPLTAGYTSLTLVTAGDGRIRVGTPSDTLETMLNPPALATQDSSVKVELPLENLAIAARLITAVTARFGRGQGQILPVAVQPGLISFRGRVVSQVGANLTPNQIMPGAVVHLYRANWMRYGQPPGVSHDLFTIADWNGEFGFGALWISLVTDIWTKWVTLDAAVLTPETGEITWALSQGKSGIGMPYAVQSVPLPQLARSLASAVLFRCAPVQVFPMPDPNTMNSYAGLGFMQAGTLASPKEQYIESGGGGYICFVPPETRLLFNFRKGSKANPNLMEIRAFALNAAGELDQGEFRPGGIVGQGYFAADTPSLINIEIDVARSMAQLDDARLRIQRKYNMADQMVLQYGAASINLANEATRKTAAGNQVEAKSLAAESIAYSANAYPVIRKNASDAIVGILFYLMLAIPFAVFVEKLLIGHPDLRMQLLGQGVIFILFFLALRTFHPAYELVRSSYMILLGFVTFALALAVGMFVSARFSRNIAELQRRIRREVETADVSRAGAAATAFLLGLNNLRKRPVRTALTMLTLVLVTFVMICFASVSTNVVDIEFPVGQASYSGLLVHDRLFKDVAPALAPLRELYGETYSVSPRRWAGNFVPIIGRNTEYAEYLVTRAVGDRTYEAKANAILGLSSQEGEITDLKNSFGVLNRWFEKDDEKSCFLPRTMADALQLTDQDVTGGKAMVQMGGKDYTVQGIFDDAKADAVLDLDGDSLMPIDVLSLRSPAVVSVSDQASSQSENEIPEDVPRLAARKVVIAPADNMPTGAERTASIAVHFRGLDYAASRQLISSHLERTAEPAYYGIDGVAFFGGKFRMQSVEGLLDLLLPIIIAALTVMNTMRGSVYERRSELFVFNAVGLAPNHIRFLFLAEASVYAVVGVVGGYLLAQSSGSILKLLGLAGGLTINYTSLSAVAVSVVIMLVVFASSIFPARMAAQLAAPSETMTRKRETASADVMELELPFTFNKRDRIGVIPYFGDWFENYGEGSSGEFFCSRPIPSIRIGEDGHAMPCLTAITWLKPYDLGVSQTVDLVVQYNPKTSDNVARVIMTRKSGDHSSWERCNHRFIGLLRKRFLTWRAVSEADRKGLLERGRGLLDPEYRPPAPPAVPPAG